VFFFFFFTYFEEKNVFGCAQATVQGRSLAIAQRSIMLYVIRAVCVCDLDIVRSKKLCRKKYFSLRFVFSISLKNVEQPLPLPLASLREIRCSYSATTENFRTRRPSSLLPAIAPILTLHEPTIPDRTDKSSRYPKMNWSSFRKTSSFWQTSLLSSRAVIVASPPNQLYRRSSGIVVRQQKPSWYFLTLNFRESIRARQMQKLCVK